MVGSSGVLLRTCSLLSKTLHVCGVSFLCFQGADCTLSSILAPLSGDHLFYKAGPGPARGSVDLGSCCLTSCFMSISSSSVPPSFQFGSVYSAAVFCFLWALSSLLLGSGLFCVSLFSKPCFTVGHDFCPTCIFIQVLGFPNNLFPFVQWAVVCGGLLFKM